MLASLNLRQLGLPEFHEPIVADMPRGQVLVLEAVSLLTSGEAGSWADQLAAVRLVNRLWAYPRSSTGLAARRLIDRGLLREGRVIWRDRPFYRRQGKRDPEGQQYAGQVLALTAEGRIEHHSQRARFFRDGVVL